MMKKKVRIYKKPCMKCGGQTHMKEGGQFEPHMMYNPETGQGFPAESMEDHLSMKEQGFLHKEEMPKKQFGSNQFSKRLAKELKSTYKPFSSTAPQNQNTDEVVGERKNMFVSKLSNNAMVSMAEQERQNMIQEQSQNPFMKMGGSPFYNMGGNYMSDQFGGQYTQDMYMPMMENGGDTENTQNPEVDPIEEALKDPYAFDSLFYNYFGTDYSTYEKSKKTIKGFGDVKNFVSFVESGPMQKKAATMFLGALLSNNPKFSYDIGNQLDNLDVSTWYSLDVLPWSNEDKLEDMAAIAREEARGKVYDEAQTKMKEFDQKFDDELYLELKTTLNEKFNTATGKDAKRYEKQLNNLERIKGVIQQHKKDPNSIINYHLPNQIDWDPSNWGEAYGDFIDMYDAEFGTDKNPTPLTDQYQVISYAGIASDIRNKITGISPNAPGVKTAWTKQNFINDDIVFNKSGVDNYLERGELLEPVEITDESEGDNDEDALLEEALKNQTPPAEAQTPVQPKVVVPKPKKQQPVQNTQPTIYEGQGKKGLSERAKKLLLMKSQQNKYGGNINTYEHGGQHENYMNVPGDAFSNIYSNDELREKLNNRFLQANPQNIQDIQAEEQPEMFPAFKDLKWYDKQTTGFDKYATKGEVGPIPTGIGPYFNKIGNMFENVAQPFRKAGWHMKEAMYNPNADFGYSREDGMQVRMNKDGEEKFDVLGSYGNALRMNPFMTIGATIGNIGQVAGDVALNMKRMNEDRRFQDFVQRKTMADQSFSPVDNELKRGNWTVNQGYFNPDLTTMQPWFTGQAKYGGDIVNMSDEEIKRFLRAGGQIEYLD